MNKYQKIDMVFPPYTKEPELITAKPESLANDADGATAPTLDATGDALQKFWSNINQAYDEV
jgi:hypothetical protein